MLKSLGVENFKAFKENSVIDFKKINVLLGPNSSGKSSYLKALLTINNTLKSKESEPALNLNDQIGGFRSIVHGKSSDSVRFRFKLDDNISVEEVETELINESVTGKGAVFLYAIIRLTNVDNSFDFNKYKETIQKLYRDYRSNPVKEFIFSVKETPKKPNTINKFKMILLNNDEITIFTRRNSYYMKFNGVEFKEPNLVEPYKFYFNLNSEKVLRSRSSEIPLLINVAFALKEIEYDMNTFMKNFIHIEPFRNEPKRTELVTNFKFNSVGPKGENILSTVIGLNEEKDKNKARINLKTEVNYWLNEFDLATAVDVEELRNNTYSLVVKNKFTGHICNIVDVGVGTSQLLPIIIESVISLNKSVLLIEEPETHIHPNAQAKLAELFVNCVKKYDKQFFIETHSMYLVRQLQILVAKNELSPSNLGIYYFEQDENGSHIKNMTLSENGQFEEEFPKGFFDVPYQLTKQFMEYI